LGEGAGTQGALSTDMRSTDAQLVTKPSAVPRRWLWGGVALLVGVSAAVLLTVRSSGSESPPLETDATGSAAAAAASGEVELAVSTTASRSEPTASASASASAAAGAPPTASLQPPAVPTTHVVPHPRRVTPPDDPWQ
jgi:hypothetical protein